MNSRSKSKRVVLLGIGHTNAHILRRWTMAPPADTELVCITDHAMATYSGMLPAVLAGLSPESDMQIDLVRLSAAASAMLITETVSDINPETRRIKFASRPDLSYDLLSIGIGSVPTFDSKKFDGDQVIPTKPMQSLLERISTRVRAIHQEQPSQPYQVVIVGGGVATIELSLCLPAYLRSLSDLEFEVTIVTSGDQVASELNRRASVKILAALNRANIKVRYHSRAVRVEGQHLHLLDGRTVRGDLIVVATHAAPGPLLKQIHLDKDDRGFLLTDTYLRSTSSQQIFAVGDSGSIHGHQLPKAGVYAVRQGPILWKNINRSLMGLSPIAYRPQSNFLKLINVGDSSAVGQYRQLSFSGKWVMGWKKRIDDRFLSMYSPKTSQQMASTGDPHDDPLIDQCRGCGCKLDSESLRLALTNNSDSGSMQYRDAVPIAEFQEHSLLASTDFFTAPFADPFVSGQVAANHSLSDLIAGGAKPLNALSNIVIPDGPKHLQQEQLTQLTAGANRELSAFDVKIDGGHTIVGPRLELGFTVIGKRVTDTQIGKDQLDVGDQLYLTKPIGSGILMAAHMRAALPAAAYQSMLDSMLSPLPPWLQVIKSLHLKAVTDITGFGLCGHLLEMLFASQCTATIDLERIPLMPGVIDQLKAGFQSTLAPDNQKNLQHLTTVGQVEHNPAFPAIFDPQTCGGLLLSVPPKEIENLTKLIDQYSLPIPAWIGQVDSDEITSKPLTLK